MTPRGFRPPGGQQRRGEVHTDVQARTRAAGGTGIPRTDLTSHGQAVIAGAGGDALPDAVLDALPVAVAVLGHDGTLTQANAALRRLLRVPADRPVDPDGAVVAALAATGVLARGSRRMAGLVAATATAALPRPDGPGVAVTVTVAHRPDGTSVLSLTPEASSGSPDAITRHDGDGVCVSASPAVAGVYGRAPSELVGVALPDVVVADDRADVAAAAARALAGHATAVSFRCERMAGTASWVDAVLAPAAPGFVCDARDGTLRVAAEAGYRARAERAEREATEHDALRRVAMAIAIESDSAAAQAMVADEVSRLIGSDVGMVVRIDGRTATVTATGGASVARVGDSFEIRDGSTIGRLATTDATVRGRCLHVAALHGETDPAWVVATPVHNDGQLWGAVIASGREGRPVPVGAEPRVERFAELASVAIVAAETRARLARQATTDPLTGLANHRSFHERLRTEVERAHRYNRPLSLALVDLDHFKRFNDTFGHQAGDHVLAKVAAQLSGTARRSELVARVGGEEFAWLMPETGADTALGAVERARALMGAEAAWGDEHQTLSAGVCDLARARDGDELFRHADAALYWAKANGRNQACVYSPEVVDSMSPEERARRADRSRTLGALRSLARAVDAKDTATNKHSVRVAAMAQRAAIALGWGRERAEYLRDAALLHDVGKLGVPDAILLKQGPLSLEEYEVVKRHSALGAEITSDVLEPEQCGWVRHHHERWDGSGYPDALAGDAVPIGSRIIAVADAWDVMTSVHPYGAVLDPAAAAGELTRGVGTQFWGPAVEALLRVVFGPPALRRAA
ncbi:MAG: diguanylate cyclase [Thermoleophilia bacterium]|nr:diguanylate cyclase [Thermoleophilia bacterium]